jgi:hypothetical protein
MQTQKAKTFKSAVIYLAGGGVVTAIGGPFFTGIGTAALIFGVVNLLRALFQATTASPNENIALDICKDLPYQSFHGDTGIGLDPEKKELHLYAKPTFKTYKFDEVRRWETNIQTGGQVFGTGLALAAANVSTIKSNLKNSGLFIEVRDIDNPRWKISFDPRKMEKELPRWMEILRQHINES